MTRFERHGSRTVAIAATLAVLALLAWALGWAYSTGGGR